MGQGYRSWEERRQIVRSAIAETGQPPLSSFDLTPSEEVYFRARSAKLVDQLARRSSNFKAYYALPAAKPFGYVIGLSSVIAFGAISAGVYVYLRSKGAVHTYPLLAASATLAIAAIGWWVAGGISHRNTIRQNTNNLLFARFSQAPFGDAMHRFHGVFGNDLTDRVSNDRVVALRTTGNDDDRRAATSVTYLLNYFEFIASGVLRGDLDQTIVRDNIRGVVIFYYDKCEPYIRVANKRNPKTYESLIKLRTHYREP